MKHRFLGIYFIIFILPLNAAHLHIEFLYLGKNIQRFTKKSPREITIVDKQTRRPIKTIYPKSSWSYLINDIPAGQYLVNTYIGNYFTNTSNWEDCFLQVPYHKSEKHYKYKINLIYNISPINGIDFNQLEFTQSKKYKVHWPKVAHATHYILNIHRKASGGPMSKFSSYGTRKNSSSFNLQPTLLPHQYFISIEAYHDYKLIGKSNKICCGKCGGKEDSGNKKSGIELKEFKHKKSNKYSKTKSKPPSKNRTRTRKVKPKKKVISDYKSKKIKKVESKENAEPKKITFKKKKNQSEVKLVIKDHKKVIPVPELRFPKIKSQIKPTDTPKEKSIAKENKPIPKKEKVIQDLSQSRNLLDLVDNAELYQ